jgi:hypothetical protein
MKPLVSPAALKIGLILLGTVLVAIGEAPSLQGLMPALYQHLLAIVGTALLGKELLQRTGDVAVSDLPLEWQAPEPERKDEAS